MWTASIWYARAKSILLGLNHLKVVLRCWGPKRAAGDPEDKEDRQREGLGLGVLSQAVCFTTHKLLKKYSRNSSNGLSSWEANPTVLHKGSTGYLKSIPHQVHGNLETDKHNPHGGQSWVLRIWTVPAPCIRPQKEAPSLAVQPSTKSINMVGGNIEIHMDSGIRCEQQAVVSDSLLPSSG